MTDNTEKDLSASEPDAAETPEPVVDATSDDATTQDPTPSANGEGNHGANRDWVVPVIGLGAVVLSIVVFFAGFAVGRVTDDEDHAEGPGRVMVQVTPGDRDPRGGPRFEDFGRNAPRGGFRFPDLIGPGGALEDVPTPRLDRLCSLLDDGNVPNEFPFIDQLKGLCDSVAG